MQGTSGTIFTTQEIKIPFALRQTANFIGPRNPVNIMYREDCPCPKTECERHKNSDPCRAYHGAKGKLPYCERPQPKNPVVLELRKAFKR